MREQIPEYLPFAYFFLCDLHPHTLEKAEIPLARKVDTDGKCIVSELLSYDHREERLFF
jgi:hypothetical protein